MLASTGRVPYTVTAGGGVVHLMASFGLVVCGLLLGPWAEIAETLAVPVWAAAASLEVSAAGHSVVDEQGQGDQGDGDAVGTGAFTLRYNPANPDRRTGKLCYSVALLYSSSAPTAAAIHEAPAGVSGPALVALRRLRPKGEIYARKGCAKLAVSDLEELRSSPESFYLQIPTESFPSGAVRGQLQTED